MSCNPRASLRLSKFLKPLVLFFLVFAPLTAEALYAQVCTSTNTPSRLSPDTKGAWPQNVIVTVNISGDFSPEEVECLQAVFDDFNLDNSSAAGNSSGVYFSVHYNTPGVAVITGDGTSVNTTGVSYGLQVERLDTGPVLLGRTYHGHNGTNRTSAVVVINSRLGGCDGCEAMRMTMAHEIGHTFNLDECYNCDQGVSIMNEGPNVCDTAHGLTSPSECDNARIRNNGGYNQNTVNQPCPDLDHNGIGDCEEESGDDDETDCYNTGGTWDPNTGTCDYFNCDPSGQQESQCYSGGGVWDAYNCTCDYNGVCDPDGSQEQACIASGGVWRPEECNCGSSNGNVCEPLEPEEAGEYVVAYEYCSFPEQWYCEERYIRMRQCYEPGDATSVCNNCDEWEEYQGISCVPVGGCNW